MLAVVLGLAIVSTGNAHALDPATAAAAVGYFNTAFSAFKNLNSLFDGTDRDLARKLDQVKEDLIQEMYRIDAAAVADDVKWLVDEYREISENSTMTGIDLRFQNFLSRSYETLFELERRLVSDPKVTLDAKYSLATPFNIVAFLRLTAMKDAPQLLGERGGFNQTSIDRVFQKALQTDYELVGARNLHVKGSSWIPFSWIPGFKSPSHIYTVRGKWLWQKVTDYDFTCSESCFNQGTTIFCNPGKDTCSTVPPVVYWNPNFSGGGPSGGPAGGFSGGGRPTEFQCASAEKETKCMNSKIGEATNKYDADSVVQIVRAAMEKIVQQGYQSVTDSKLNISGRLTPVCVQGLVWREANQNDFVCVTAQMRSQAQDDNTQAKARRNPDGGPYGPDTCLEGFVWREAFVGDHVCVMGEMREQAAEDNRLADSRRQPFP